MKHVIPHGKVKINVKFYIYMCVYASLKRNLFCIFYLLLCYYTVVICLAFVPFWPHHIRLETLSIRLSLNFLKFFTQQLIIISRVRRPVQELALERHHILAEGLPEHHHVVHVPHRRGPGLKHRPGLARGESPGLQVDLKGVDPAAALDRYVQWTLYVHFLVQPSL